MCEHEEGTDMTEQPSNAEWGDGYNAGYSDGLAEAGDLAVRLAQAEQRVRALERALHWTLNWVAPPECPNEGDLQHWRECQRDAENTLTPPPAEEPCYTWCNKKMGHLGPCLSRTRMLRPLNRHDILREVWSPILYQW